VTVRANGKQPFRDAAASQEPRVLSERSRRTYTAAWSLFTDWCAVTGHLDLPADWPGRMGHGSGGGPGSWEWQGLGQKNQPHPGKWVTGGRLYAASRPDSEARPGRIRHHPHEQLAKRPLVWAGRRTRAG
jgi:hypothetical protein